MKVTVLWEDQRGSTKGFGPHDLLVRCLADRLQRDGFEIHRGINSVPKKGIGKLLGALETDLRNLTRTGPVFAVIDRDRVHEHLRPPLPNDCMMGIKKHLREQVQQEQHECEVVFLDRNIESLVDAAFTAMGEPAPRKKLSPDERDRCFQKLASNNNPPVRAEALRSCPSFARLVERVAAALSR